MTRRRFGAAFSALLASRTLSKPSLSTSDRTPHSRQPSIYEKKFKRRYFILAEFLLFLPLLSPALATPMFETIVDSSTRPPSIPDDAELFFDSELSAPTQRGYLSRGARLNNNGDVLYRARYRKQNGEIIPGAWIREGSATRTLFIGDMTPASLPEMSPEVRIRSIFTANDCGDTFDPLLENNIVFTDSGAVVLNATLSGPGITPQDCSYRWDPAQGMPEVANDKALLYFRKNGINSLLSLSGTRLSREVPSVILGAWFPRSAHRNAIISPQDPDFFFFQNASTDWRAQFGRGKRFNVQRNLVDDRPYTEMFDVYHAGVALPQINQFTIVGSRSQDPPRFVTSLPFPWSLVTRSTNGRYGVWLVTFKRSLIPPDDQVHAALYLRDNEGTGSLQLLALSGVTAANASVHPCANDIRELPTSRPLCTQGLPQGISVNNSGNVVFSISRPNSSLIRSIRQSDGSFLNSVIIADGDTIPQTNETFGGNFPEYDGSQNLVGKILANNDVIIKGSAYTKEVIPGEGRRVPSVRYYRRTFLLRASPEDEVTTLLAPGQYLPSLSGGTVQLSASDSSYGNEDAAWSLDLTSVIENSSGNFSAIVRDGMDPDTGNDRYALLLYRDRGLRVLKDNSAARSFPHERFRLLSGTLKDNASWRMNDRNQVFLGAPSSDSTPSGWGHHSFFITSGGSLEMIDTSSAILSSPVGASTSIDFVDPNSFNQQGQVLGVGFTADSSAALFRITLESELVNCLADFDRNGLVNVEDMTAFVAAFLRTDPLADFDRNGEVRLADLFQYLNAWFGGCS